MVKENDKATFAAVAEEHLRDADRLKKAWFDHVLSSLEKLGASVVKLSSELHMAKDDLFKDIIATRDELRKDLLCNRAEITVDIDKLERRIEKNIDKINKNIDSISIQAVKDELKEDLADLKSKMNEDIVLLRKESLPLRDSITRLKVKVAIWGVVGGAVGAIILSIFNAFFFWFVRYIK